ncbi:transposase [Deinococcus sp. NW-56]|uniref:transposase n=1 Tax=Deinococcus sp. NW-56 TaxID=2080419 RepID=UPI003519884C
MQVSDLWSLSCPAPLHERRHPEARPHLTPCAEDRFRALNSARARQSEEEWLKAYQVRAGIEGTMSQAVRRFDLRRARYWGLAKVGLQAVSTAAALNLVRFDAWIQGIPRISGKVPILTRISVSA